ncbi:class I SAM-dependent methyltransferase [Peribacillus huizhouensis]|uniref:Ubiquinone/menaquinone biosynthesis C-methylase UbiE n=2 Tax=Bacillaceae TaxID=186817 RepID=A0ABR6CRU9_9BACI|nr:class I SAM-dependent methyltransferase [Peribacillus huizhouensis]MBA9027739.1 ubiquinone/menaquinone biosynthesis C-methylase UbiE [Peribacillus huizhouensis]
MGKVPSAQDSWNANLYDRKHSFVTEYGNRLIELLAPKAGEKILDLGCGTGDLVKKLHDYKVDVVGVDQSKNMVMQAKNKYPTLKFFVQDATNLEYKNEFDAVFSNATLHWVKQPKQALNCIYNSLREDGRFIAEFGGKGNVKTITDEMINQFKESGISYQTANFPWYFPSIAEYSTLMEEAGFKVTFAEHFARPTRLDGDDGLKNWMNMFGSEMFEGIDQNKKEDIITQVEIHLKPIIYIDDHWIADYKRIRIIGIK